MNSAWSFKDNSDNAPERGNSLSSKEVELLRAYYETVAESFALLHNMGFARSPDLIRAAMGMTATSQANPEQEAKVIQFPTRVVERTAATDYLEDAQRKVTDAFDSQETDQEPRYEAAS